MHRFKHEYTCNRCGSIAEHYETPLREWRHWILGPDPIRDREKDVRHFDFCSEECENKWLIEHNFEVEE